MSSVVAFWLVLRPYGPFELLFKVLLGVLSVSFVGCAAWVGFSGTEVLQGLFRVEMPGMQGQFSAIEVTMAMVGAVGGSFMNLVYPYFLEEKGWRGPKYLRVQFYDLLLGITAMIVLNLAVWVLGAELLYPDKQISQMEDLPNLLSEVLGPSGRLLFYAGIFAAVFSSVVGISAGIGALGAHSWIRWKEGRTGATADDWRNHPWRNRIAAWCLFTPLIWTLPGMPDFVTLTLAANAGQVVLLPLIAGGLWKITASGDYIGDEYKNRWWENLAVGALFLLAIWGAFESALVVLR